MINARIKEGYFWINLAVNAVIIILICNAAVKP